MEFAITVSEHGDASVITCSGELDAHSAPQLSSVLEPLTVVHGCRVVADLSGVGFMDSTGLAVLVTALKHVREAEGTFDLVVSSPRVLKVLQITGLDVVIPLHETLAEALSQ